METSIPTRIAIVGGGISALLLAHRLKLRVPTLHIDIYEQEEVFGGRLTGRDATLRVISSNLGAFWDQSLRCDPESKDIFQLTDVEHLETIGLAAQGKMFEIDRANMFSQTTIKILSNRQVAQHWEKFMADTSNKKCKTLDRLYVATLNKLAPLLGLPDISNLAISACQKKISVFAAREVMYADWQPALEALACQAQVDIHTDCPIGSATYDTDKGWNLVSKAGETAHDNLVVAQPLLSAENWLEKKHLDAFALRKEAPTSSLCIGIAAGQTSLPNYMLVANDQTLAVRADDLYILSIRLGFEVSLQAPRVLQALGKLKRAARFLQKIDARIKASPLWVALLPAACVVPVPIPSSDSSLFFCGDNYGDNSEDGDSNLIDSILHTVDCIGVGKTGGG